MPTATQSASELALNHHEEVMPQDDSSLDRFNVPPVEQRELLAIVDTTKADIVVE